LPRLSLPILIRTNIPGVRGPRPRPPAWWRCVWAIMPRPWPPAWGR
jgi:hypothetical protein